MKKILWIVALVLLWCNVGFAQEITCQNKIDMEWNMYERTDYARFKITSSCEHPIYMLYVNVKTNDLKEVKRKNLNKDYIRPYGVATYDLYIGDLNQDILSKGNYNYSLRAPERKLVPLEKEKSGVSNTNIAGWVIGLAFIFIIGYLWHDAQNPNTKKTKNVKENDQIPVKRNRTEEGIISKVWNGYETMSKTFWLYCILTTFIISLVSGFVLASLGSLMFIMPVIVIIWSNTGLWRSSEIYENKKLRKKQPYGWATAAKVYVVLNYITTLSQIGLALNV